MPYKDYDSPSLKDFPKEYGTFEREPSSSSNLSEKAATDSDGDPETTPLQTMNRFDRYFDEIEDRYEIWKMFVCLIPALVLSTTLAIFLFQSFEFKDLFLELSIIAITFLLVQAAATSLLYRIFFRDSITLVAVYVWLFMLVIDG